jgi:hypothetical protein
MWPSSGGRVDDSDLTPETCVRRAVSTRRHGREWPGSGVLSNQWRRPRAGGYIVREFTIGKRFRRMGFCVVLAQYLVGLTHRHEHPVQLRLPCIALFRMVLSMSLNCRDSILAVAA